MARIPTAKIVVDGRRKIVNADDSRVTHGQKAVEEKGPEEVTRTSVARMKRGEVIELLEAHGVSEADCGGVNLPDLRAKLTRIMFADL